MLKFLFLAIPVLFMFFSCDGESRKIKKYTDKPASVMFEDLKTLYTEKSRKIMEFGANEAFSLIIKNQKEFEQAIEKIKKANNMSDVISEVADNLTRISENYQKIAGLSNDIGKYTINTMDELSIGEKATEKAIKINLDEIAKLDVEMEKARVDLRNDLIDNNQKMMLEATVHGNASMINSLRAQNTIWKKFGEKQARVLKSLNSSSHSIGAILFVLQKNADVYAVAAQTARMSKNVHELLGNLNALQNIDAALRDLQDSWSDLNDIINEIAAINFEDSFNRENIL